MGKSDNGRPRVRSFLLCCAWCYRRFSATFTIPAAGGRGQYVRRDAACKGCGRIVIRYVDATGKTVKHYKR